MSEAELYEQAKEAFYAWEDKCAIEWVRASHVNNGETR